MHRLKNYVLTIIIFAVIGINVYFETSKQDLEIKTEIPNSDSENKTQNLNSNTSNSVNSNTLDQGNTQPKSSTQDIVTKKEAPSVHVPKIDDITEDETEVEIVNNTVLKQPSSEPDKTEEDVVTTKEVVTEHAASMDSFVEKVNPYILDARVKNKPVTDNDALSKNMQLIKEYLQDNPNSLSNHPTIRDGLLGVVVHQNGSYTIYPNLIQEIGNAGFLFFPGSSGVNEEVFVPCVYAKNAKSLPSSVYWLYPSNRSASTYKQYDTYTTNVSNYNNSGYIAEMYHDGFIVRPSKMSEVFSGYTIYLPTNTTYWKNYTQNISRFTDAVIYHEITHVVLEKEHNFPNLKYNQTLPSGLTSVQNTFPVLSRAASVAEVHEFIATAVEISTDERNLAPAIIKLIRRNTYNSISDQYVYMYHVLEESLGKCVSDYTAVEKEMIQIYASGESYNEKKSDADRVIKDFFSEVTENELICIRGTFKDMAVSYLEAL